MLFKQPEGALQIVGKSMQEEADTVEEAELMVQEEEALRRQHQQPQRTTVPTEEASQGGCR